MKFNPRRPSILLAERLPHEVWGHAVIRPLYTDSELLRPATVHQALMPLCLDGPLKMLVFRLVAFSKRLPGFKPDRVLPIAPISAHEKVEDEILVWRGTGAELKIHKDKLQKAAAAAARRAQRPSPAARPAANREKKPRRAPNAQAEAAKAAKRGDAAHQQLLALMDRSKPGDETDLADRLSIDSDIGTDSIDASASARSPSDHEDLDATLASLKGKGPGLKEPMGGDF